MEDLRPYPSLPPDVCLGVAGQHMADSGAPFPLFHCAFVECHRSQDITHAEMPLERHVIDDHFVGKAFHNLQCMETTSA